MELDVIGNKIIVKGNVKSIKDFTNIKKAIDPIILHDKYIIIDLVDSISLTSSVIGYLSKLVNIDGVKIEMYVGDKGLYELLDDLGLIDIFKVKRR